MKELIEKDKSTKILLFAQWEGLISKIRVALNSFSIQFSHITGGNIYSKTKAIRDFNFNPEVRIMLMSLDSSASGTNLTVANHVFFVHPMLAKDNEQAVAYEKQAIGRILRPGQTKDVTVWRFVAEETLEEELLNQRADIDPSQKAENSVPASTTSRSS